MSNNDASTNQNTEWNLLTGSFVNVDGKSVLI